MPHDLRRLVRHGDHAWRMTHLYPARQSGLARHQRRKHRRIAMQDKARICQIGNRNDQSCDNSRRSTVTAHGINRNHDAWPRLRAVTDRHCNGRRAVARTVHLACLMRGLRRVLVKVRCFDRGHNFACIVVATSAADVVRPLQLAAIRAFARICSHQSIMRPAHAGSGRGRFRLRDSHVSPKVVGTCP